MWLLCWFGLYRIQICYNIKNKINFYNKRESFKPKHSVVHSVSVIMPPFTAGLWHGKPASSGTCCYTCLTPGLDKTDIV